ncbi:uncharacterized protein LOC117829320 [Notolabrus celidotus]|uniref:uncharacterized protein LOC117829320 n=1 Tax=Notolabrus celidotus TaxID=1203425 RepID=UPI0014904349|nr:uncharacterized protein LOC117829320 [Notolabrus celidotus]
MDTFSSKLQQKALQQPKQKKSKSAEFLMGREERAAVVGIGNPAFDGGGSTELSVSPLWLGREIRGDRPDSTLAAHQKKMELQAPAKERGNNRVQNYFDPSSAEQTDPRHGRMAGVSAEDELELTILNADENRLYRRITALLDEDDTSINIPGTLQASRDEEVLEVKAGDPVLQRRLLLHGGGDASGSRPSQAHTAAKTQAGTGAGLGGEAGLEAGRMVMGGESAVKMRTAKEAIPHYAQQLRERVRPDMITLGSLSLQQLNQSPAPQSVEVSLRCLRATRDKLPRGLYSVSVALHSRLGGPAVAWCCKKEQQQWAVTTEPVEHRGRYFDTDLQVNQSVFMILPAACEVVPSMVLVFRLIALPGPGSHVSSVLAWGAFPVCGPSLSHVQGRFKTPLLRGEPNTQLDRFRVIEALMSSDLDHWLCNLYFQIKRLPSGGQEHCIALSIPTSNPHPEVQHDQSQCHLPPQPQPLSQTQLRPQFIHPQSQLNPQQLHAGPSSRAGEPAVVHSHRGSPLHLSADSACSSSSLPGKNSSSGAISGNTGEKSDPCREKVEGGIHYKKKPIKKTNSCGPSMSGSSAPPRQADKQKMQNLSAEEMEEYTFSLQ